MDLVTSLTTPSLAGIRLGIPDSGSAPLGEGRDFPSDIIALRVWTLIAKFAAGGLIGETLTAARRKSPSCDVRCCYATELTARRRFRGCVMSCPIRCSKTHAQPPFLGAIAAIGSVLDGKAAVVDSDDGGEGRPTISIPATNHEAYHSFNLHIPASAISLSRVMSPRRFRKLITSTPSLFSIMKPNTHANASLVALCVLAACARLIPSASFSRTSCGSSAEASSSVPRAVSRK
jgi:hypothetical protein